MYCLLIASVVALLTGNRKLLVYHLLCRDFIVYACVHADASQICFRCQYQVIFSQHTYKWCGCCSGIFIGLSQNLKKYKILFSVKKKQSIMKADAHIYWMALATGQ